MSTTPVMPASANWLVFKGLKQGLTLVIPEEKPFTFWLEVLAFQLEQAGDFFRGARVIVETGARKLTTEEKDRLERLLASYHMTVSFLPLTVKKRRLKQEKYVSTRTLMVKGTVRCGQKVEFNGSVVVKGDVNPGAEIVATGDIIVFGRLRGLAHAGAGGDKDAEIMALSFNPVQVRIAHLFSRAPEEREERTGPEVARVRNGRIVVERYG